MELTPDLLLRAYAFGVFPMAEGRARRELYWIDPEQRGVLPLDTFHVPRSLRRTVKRGRFDVRVNTAFEEVMCLCAEPTATRPDSWINDEILRLYTGLFDRGHAHSIECWQDDQLVGGLYGVSLGAAFFGESMVSRATDASKVALVHLVARLRLGGYTLLDTQFVTDHLGQFGTVEIPRGVYRDQLAIAIETEAEFPVQLTDAQLAAFLQSTTHTS